MKTIVTGVLLLDKPKGITSQTAVSKAKNALKSPHHDSKKAGHTGTLDPMATGLLPICFGGATKFANFGLDANKSYLATIKLGQKTDTGDADGQILENKSIPPFNDEKLTNIAHELIGNLLQTPPIYSALKKDGKKLYEYARAGIDVKIAPRPITIFSLNLTKINNSTVQMQVSCSKGTYVRVLGEMIAEKLGTVGHLTDLRRTATGGFDITQTISLDNFLAMDFNERLNLLKSADCLMPQLPRLTITDEQYTRLKLGQRLNVYTQCDHHLLEELKNSNTPQAIQLFTHDNFVGVGHIEHSGRLQPIRLL